MSDFMKRYGKRMFSLFAVLLMVAACLVFLDLDPEESEAADAVSKLFPDGQQPYQAE